MYQEPLSWCAWASYEDGTAVPVVTGAGNPWEGTQLAVWGSVMRQHSGCSLLAAFRKLTQ